MLKKIFYTFAIYIVLEGALRKWVFPQFSVQLFLMKDVLLILMLGVFLNNQGFRKVFIPKDIRAVVLIVFIFFCSVFILNFSGLTSVIGLRYYLVILPIILTVPLVFSDFSELERMAFYYLLLTAVVCLIGFAQYYSPVDSFLNKYSWSKKELHIATILDVSGTSRARITGTFSYITPYSIHIQSMFFIGLAIFLTSQGHMVRNLTALILTLIFANVLLTGSRSSLLLILLFTLPYISRTRIKTIFSGTLALAFCVVMFGSDISALFDAVVLRNERADDATDRIAGTLMTPINTILNTGLIGTGIGSTFLGFGELDIKAKHQSLAFNEVVQDRIGLETGVLVYIGLLTIRILFILKSIRLYRLLRSNRFKVWCLASIILQVSWVWKIPFYQTTGMVFYCFAIGLYLLLEKEHRKLARTSNKEQQTLSGPFSIKAYAQTRT
jgi:hypothetical protein